jgi:hypothetical protein
VACLCYSVQLPTVDVHGFIKFHVVIAYPRENMMELWKGVDTYDACTQNEFKLHDAFLWSIHDYLGYATMSGCSTKGSYACVHCDVNPCSEPLTHKIGYTGHRRFLREDHPYRRSKLFHGKAEHGDPPRKCTPEELA